MDENKNQESEIQKLQIQSFERLNPSKQHLVAELIDCRKTIEYLTGSLKDTELEKKGIIKLCTQKLDEAEGAAKKNDIFATWHLIHRVYEELVLLMNKEELLALGSKLIQDLMNTSFSDSVKNVWKTKIEEELTELKNVKNGAVAVEDTEATKESKDETATGDYTKKARQLFKTVLNVINDHTDNRFWEIWSKKFLTMIYTGALILSMGAFFYYYTKQGNSTIECLGVILLGVMGGLASGIFTGETPYMEKGHFWISTVYHFLIRPTSGALAAVIMFWMIQGQYLIKIDPPLPTEQVNSAPSGTKQDSPGTTAPQVGESKASTPPAGEENTDKTSLIVFAAAKGRQIYLYMLILLMAGFSGDKLLRTVSDKMLSKLFSEAEKTKEAKSS